MKLHFVATDPSGRPTLTSSAATTLTVGPAASGTLVDGLALANTGSGGAVAEALSVTAGSALTVRHAEIHGPQCGESADAAPLVIEDSTLESATGANCLTLGTGSVVRRSTLTRAANGFTNANPPPTLVTGGLVEDSSITGGVTLATPDAAIRRSTSISGRRAAIAGQGLVVDTVVISAALNGIAVNADAQGGTLRVVNSTILAPHGIAVIAQAGCSATPEPNNLVSLTNDIVRGATIDLRATPGVTCSIGTSAHFGFIQVDHSNFETRDPAAGSATAAALLEGSGNQSADPLFVDGANADATQLDLHLKPGSPAIDAGSDATETGTLDRDGAPRRIAAGVDLGAYEVQPPPPPPPPPGPTGSTATPDVVAPALTKPHLGAPAFRTGRRRGTTLTATLSENATLRIVVSQLSPGRRSGRRCTKPTAKLRRAPRCTRALALKPAITLHAAAGAVRTRFTGLLGAHVLKPGRYRLSITATDAAGNTSAPIALPFTVLR